MPVSMMVEQSRMMLRCGQPRKRMLSLRPGTAAANRDARPGRSWSGARTG